MRDQYQRVYAVVHLDAITANMAAMRQNVPQRTMMIGVVKADGYGHGAVPVAQAIAPYVGAYATATIDEALNLRRHKIEKPILVLGVTHESRYEELIRENLRPAIFTLEQAQPLSALAMKMGKQAVIHLALDTGMSRIGMNPDSVNADIAAQIAGLPGITIEGLFTHFSKADEMDKAFAALQFRKYQDFTELLEQRNLRIPIRHCANSAGIIDLPDFSLDAVRAGISIYGLYPSEEVLKEPVVLTPALEWFSAIVYVKPIEQGSSVSYGGTFTAEKPMRIATIPVGYADGYPRSLSGTGYVLIRGRKARILGRICMDQFMADITDIPEAREGDKVTLVGKDGEARICIEELAAMSGGFHYEILCGISKRVPRVYMSGERILGSKDYFQDDYEEIDNKNLV